jgi:hypothetical protein
VTQVARSSNGLGQNIPFECTGHLSLLTHLAVGAQVTARALQTTRLSHRRVKKLAALPGGQHAHRLNSGWLLRRAWILYRWDTRPSRRP